MITRLVRAAAGKVEVTGYPLPDGVAVVRGRWLPVLGGLLSRLGGPAAATTLGDTIVVHPSVDLTERLLRHELAHVGQWRRRPLTFPLRYVWNHVRFGYHANPYEEEARRAEQVENSEGGDHGDHGR